MNGSLVAIDVAILVPEIVAAPARATSAALSAGHPDALRLDDTHLAHVTLAQQLIERVRLDDLFEALDRILRHEPALPLRIPGAVADHGTISLTVDRAPDLERLHELVMDAIEPFESPEGGSSAFRSDGEVIRPHDVHWVRNYREHSAHAHYRPHVTVGHGNLPPLVQPVEFRADHVAVCELGRFCTCRGVLRGWTLGAGACNRPAGCRC